MELIQMLRGLEESKSLEDIFGKTGEWEGSSGRSETFSVLRAAEYSILGDKQGQRRADEQEAPPRSALPAPPAPSQFNPPPLRASLVLSDG